MAPNLHSAAIMADIDAMPDAMRRLVHVHGYKIVRAMLDEGYDDAAELAQLLEIRRERMQAQWLSTDFIKPRQAKSRGHKPTFAELYAQHVKTAGMTW